MGYVWQTRTVPLTPTSWLVGYSSGKVYVKAFRKRVQCIVCEGRLSDVSRHGGPCDAEGLCTLPGAS